MEEKWEHEYEVQRNLHFRDPSLLMIIGATKCWMEGDRALNHKARRKIKGSLRKRRSEVKRKKTMRRSPNFHY
jgi:hypothetical protein